MTKEDESMASKKRVRRSASEWEQILERQEASGLSQLAFCRQEGISPASFAQRRARRSVPSTRSTPFVEWHVPQSGSHALQPGEMELVLPGGVRLRLRA
jgi:hypothetical protein